jgi:hypothetical protein
MNKELFEEIILKLQMMHEKNHALYKLGIDMLDFTEPYDRIIDILFKSYFNDDQLKWIDWFLYERPSLTERGKPNQAFKTDNKTGEQIEICHTIDSLWETIQEYSS